MPFKQVFGELFDLPGDLLCVTTNGMVNANGRAVMGGGCAAGARKMFPSIDKLLGFSLTECGNHVHYLGEHRYWGQDRRIRVCSFPTKEHYIEDSKLELIEQSARELMVLLDANRAYQTVLLPRPGCGLGNLTWEQVSAVLEPILDERVTVVGFEQEA